MNRTKSKFIFLFVVFIIAFQTACGPDFLFKSPKGITKILKAHTWQGVSYFDSSDNIYNVEWEFKDAGVLTVNTYYKANSKLFSTVDAEYAVSNTRLTGRIEIKGAQAKALAPEIIGEKIYGENNRWKIIELKKTKQPDGKLYVLRIARNGGQPDSTKTGIHGGLVMLEFVAKE